jgi:hypothetical protein
MKFIQYLQEFSVAPDTRRYMEEKTDIIFYWIPGSGLWYIMPNGDFYHNGKLIKKKVEKNPHDPGPSMKLYYHMDLTYNIKQSGYTEKLSLGYNGEVVQGRIKKDNTIMIGMGDEDNHSKAIDAIYQYIKER